MKQQTVAAFIDIFGVYDNVLIEILCNILMDKELPSKIVRFLARLLNGTRVFRWCSGIHDTGWIQGPSARIGT
jgi:hypothetical protein